MDIQLPNGVRLYYKKIGQGDPLLLLHGNGDSHEGLEQLGTALSDNFTVYLIDSRGHGQSSHKDEYISYQDFATDINYFLQTLALDKVNIIGHSDGAIIATILAMSKKEYLNKIVLLGLTLKPEQMKDVWKIAIRDEYEQSKHPLVELMLKEPQIEMEELQAIQIPALVVAAENDVMDTDLYVEVAKNIPLGELLIVEGADHMSYVIDTDELLGTKVSSFLKLSTCD